MSLYQDKRGSITAFDPHYDLDMNEMQYDGPVESFGSSSVYQSQHQNHFAIEILDQFDCNQIQLRKICTIIEAPIEEEEENSLEIDVEIE